MLNDKSQINIFIHDSNDAPENSTSILIEKENKNSNNNRTKTVTVVYLNCTSNVISNLIDELKGKTTSTNIHNDIKGKTTE